MAVTECRGGRRKIRDAARAAGQRDQKVRHVDELRLSDPVTRRLDRFFADLMVTLTEDGVGGDEAVNAVRAL